MNTKHIVGLATAAALLASAVAFAQAPAEPASAAQTEHAAAPHKAKKGKMCAECEAFHKQMKADREAFEASLKDKKPEELKAAKTEFRKQQQAKKDEFRKGHKCACKGHGPEKMAQETK